MANGSSNRYIPIMVTAAISGLLSAGLMFVGVWFTAVEGQGDEYLQDRQFIFGRINQYDALISRAESDEQTYDRERQFILDSLRRHDQAINTLQEGRFAADIRLAEIRGELGNIRAILERIERRGSLD